MSERTINILGAGSVLMGDDGVGPAAVEALGRRGLPAGVALYDAGLAAADVLGCLDPRDPLIVIDAIRAGGEPGTIYKAHLEDLACVDDSLGGCLSLHELNVLQALRIEALSGRPFADVTVFGVEPETVAWGQGLSPAVQAAMDKLTSAVAEHVEHIGAGCPAAAGDTTR